MLAELHRKSLLIIDLNLEIIDQKNIEIFFFNLKGPNVQCILSPYLKDIYLNII